VPQPQYHDPPGWIVKGEHHATFAHIKAQVMVSGSGPLATLIILACSVTPSTIWS
jgi:hypothetical protein